jgi:hypothetical protein
MVYSLVSGPGAFELSIPSYHLTSVVVAEEVLVGLCISKEPHLYQQQAWLETYEPMIRRTIHDRDRVIQQRLHTIDEYFPPLPVGTADR